MKPTRRPSVSLVTKRAVIMNVQFPHKWWFTLKSAVFSMSLSVHVFVSEGGGLLCESVCKADLLLDHFDNKQSSEAVDLLLTCQFAIHLLVSPCLPSGRVRSGISCLTWTLMVALTHWVCLLFFLRELMLWPPS